MQRRHKTAHTLLQPYCSVNTSVTTFKNNLDGLLKSITTGAQKNGGFFNDTAGTSADRMYGLAICYADGNLTTCNSCLSTVASNITTDCPDSKVASSWLDTGPCFIRYSNENFFSVADTTSSLIMNPYNFSDHELFGNARNTLFDKLIAKTNASANMMASGEESVNGTDTLYGLLQCTRDLNHQECYKCLSTLINILQPPSLYAYSLGVRFFGFSCYVHYEMHPFMLTQEDVSSDPSPSSQTAPSPNPVYTTAGSGTVPGPNPASPPAAIKIRIGLALSPKVHLFRSFHKTHSPAAHPVSHVFLCKAPIVCRPFNQTSVIGSLALSLALFYIFTLSRAALLNQLLVI
ncbi:Cysteine-rich repeat secretory protein 38 [Carex littledalei]|uniref:Cysteine-rich repeat secretory protein 38 n=1 Tax=Carex littledalei TaxID=544730 RepID=A0A833VPZ3_9POAL|nr:Cysteine-rich repeat secretory protein 38 [Carex littledalei]